MISTSGLLLLCSIVASRPLDNDVIVNSTDIFIGDSDHMCHMTTDRCERSNIPISIKNCVDRKKSPLKVSPNTRNAWIYSLLSATAINLVSMTGVFFKPIMNQKVFMWILMWMIGVGVGSMCSVSVIQLIPESLEVRLDKTGKNKVVVILSAIFFFYLVDRFLAVMQYSKRRQPTENEMVQSGPTNQCASDSDDRPDGIYRSCSILGWLDICEIKHGVNEFLAKIPTIVWMVFVGDALHNFVDGVTIGTAFKDSSQTGLSIFLGIFCEELPCELGDFAVFIKSGLSLRTAILFNVVSASTNYIGLIVGILISGFEQRVHSWIYCIAGGMFLYISLGVMLVEMRDIENHLIRRVETHGADCGVIRKTIAKIIAVQVLGLVIGFAIQRLVMLLND
ncbi:hypothetical protein ACOME3_004302 [Neoechinorhynchus agilis]